MAKLYLKPCMLYANGCFNLKGAAMKKTLGVGLLSLVISVFLVGTCNAQFRDIFAGDYIADTAQKVLPSVVNISSTKTVLVEQSPFLQDPFFRDFFNFVPRRRLERALGSGVIVTQDGYIITNNHVVGGAEKVEVKLSNGRVYKAKIIGTDPKSDIGVIKINATNLPAISIGDSSKLRVGTVVLAIGNPFGLGQTVTMGIISALGRSGLGIADYENFIQTDAAINPGNSGGALVNMEGKLIGINTAILSKSGGSVGIGFAIPVNLAMSVMKSIVHYGKVVRGWLGITFQDITPEIARALGLNSTRGALVSGIMHNSPAEGAGLKRGDVILAINGKEVKDASDLRIKISEIMPGTKTKLEIIRNGKEKVLYAIIGNLEKAPITEVSFVIKDNRFLGGARVGELSSMAKQQLRLPQNLKGILVLSVRRNSAAESTGIKPGDVILSINGRRFMDLEAFKDALPKMNGHKISLKIFRQGIIMNITLIR